MLINKGFKKQRTFIQKQGKAVLDPKKFDQEIEDHGCRVKVYKTLQCPNIKRIDAGEHEINCPMCNDSLFIDLDPLETMAYFNNQSLQTDLDIEGRFDEHSVIATFLSGVELQYFTKVELIDFAPIFFEMVQRQHGDLDRLKYTALRVNVLVDKSNIRYYQDTDFELDGLGNIQWLSTGRRPSLGDTYSVHYNHQVFFRAVSAMNVNRFTQYDHRQAEKTPVELNQRWLLKRDYLIVKEDYDGNPITAKNIILNEYNT